MTKSNPGKFIERLSTILVVVSAIGAGLVLVDPIFVIQFEGGTAMHVGGSGFSDQLKGAVVMLILVSGFAAVISYWLGASNTGDKAQDSVNVIATAAAPAQAAAVAAATGQPAPATPSTIATDVVNVAAETANVTAAPKAD